jgi:hypothetical protein
MKTVVDLPRPSISHHVRPERRPSIIRLGLVVSIIAALAAILLQGLMGVPPALIITVVVVIGFSLSWRASGQARREGDGT